MPGSRRSSELLLGAEPPQLIVLLREHLASCAVICGQTLAPHGHRAGQRPKCKGQSRGAETKLCQLIHTNLFKSFWVAGQTDMGEQDVDELQWKFTWHPHCLHHAATSTRQKSSSSTLGHGHGNWAMYRQEKPAQKHSKLRKILSWAW